MSMKKLVFYIESPGDMDVGIFPTNDVVTIQTESGEFTDDELEMFRETLADMYDGKALTKEEYDEKYRELTEEDCPF